MALEDILSNLYAGLTSDKVTERKKCTDSLKEYLAGSGVPSILSANHKRNTGINWEKLFVKVHDLIVKEVEKFNSGKGASTQDTVRVQCSSLLSSVVTGANKAKCYVSSEKILECMVEAFKSNRIMKYFSETYTSLLGKHVLQVSHYLNLFTPYEWADLLEASMELQERPCADASTVVRLVCCVLEEGTKRCQLTLAVRDNLQSLGALYLLQDSQRHHHMQENLLRIAVCCVNTVGAESRLATCVFTEAILASVIKFYEQQTDVASNKKKHLFTFLRLCLMIHHPGESGQSLAGNWTTWMQAVYNMQQIVRMEVALMGNSVKRLQHSHTSEWASSFIPFAVELYYQMFNGSLQAPADEEEEAAHPSKKMKLEQGDTNTYGELALSVTSTNYFPWVLIISAYFSQHGDSLSWKDKKATVDILVNILNCENFTNIIKTSALLDSIAGICRELAKDKTKLEELTLQLTSIWNTCVRKSAEVSLYQKCQNVLHALLEISSIDLPIESILKMYVEKNIPGQYVYEGLCTLHHLLTYRNSGLIDEGIRQSVVAWIIDQCLSAQCQDVLSKLLFQLCISEIVQLDDKQGVSSESRVFRHLFDDLKFLILKSDFEDGLLFDKQATQSAPLSAEKCLTFHKSVSEFIFKRLLESTKDVKKQDVSIRSLSVAFKLISLLEKYKVCESAFSTYFNQEMSAIFVRLPPLIKAIPQLSKDSRDLLKNLTCLYNSQDHTANVYKVICEATTKEVVECFCSLLGDQDETDMQDSMEFMDTDLDHQDDAEVNFKKSLLSILVNFCTQETPFRDQILTFILDCDLYNVSVPAEFQTALYVLTFIVQKLDPGSVPIGGCLNILQSMCMKLYQDNSSVSSILTLLLHTLPVVHSHGTPNNKKNCAIMLNSFLKRCNNKFYTTSTMGQALQCLSWIQMHSNLPEWDECLNNNLLEYLSNTIHSVRLCGCLCIGLDMKTASCSHFNSLLSKLPDVFLIDERDLSENIISDECANRASTVLHCLASVFTLSPIWGKSALAEILKISHKKKLSPILLGKVFLCISKYLNVASTQTLIEDNLAFFVNSWLSDGLSLDSFPYYLLLCVSKEDFLVKYKTLLIPYDMLWSGNVEKSEITQNVSQITSLPLNAIYKECLPTALALILPFMLHDKSVGSKWQPSKRLILASKNMYSLFCKTFKEASVMESVSECPVDVLMILLGYVCDEEDMRTTMHYSGPLPHVDGPLLTTQDLATILNWINEKTQLDFIFHLCCDNPAAIQQLLLRLWESVEKQHNLESKFFRLHQYWIFCHLLPLSTKLNTFLCQYVVQTLLHFMDKYNSVAQLQPLAVASCRMLFSLMKKFLPDIAQVISKMLPSIVYTVARAIGSNEDIREAGMSLLVYLIIDMNSVLPGAQYLDPLQNEEGFAKLNNVIKKMSSRKNDSILKHIKGFIQGGSVGRFEGLRLLHDKLTEYQTELNQLFTKLKAAKYSSEDCSGSLLHQLACLLIQIVGNKEDMPCCVEALRCLGVLGISDYQTLTVAAPLDPTHILQLPAPPLVPLYALPCLLTTYTTAMRADVCRAAARAITSLLKYKESVIALDLLSTNEDSALLKESLLPFTLARKSWLAVKIKIDPEGYKQLLSSEYLWSSHVLDRDHSKWVTELAVGVLKSCAPQQCFLPDLLDICQLCPSFAEKIISPLIGVIFSHGSERQISDLVQKFQGLLDAHYKATSHLSGNTGPANSSGKKHPLPKQSVECLLDILKFSFIQKKHYTNFVKSTASNISLFNLDLLTCSWAACSVGHHLAAVYFAELWCMIELDQNLPSGPDKIADLPRGTEMLAIMRKCHESMNDEAAVTGCGLSHLLDPVQRRQHYLKGGSYAEALLMHDCDADVPTGSNLLPKLSLARSLQSAGLYKLTANYLSSSDVSAELDSVKYECCWKLGDWSLQVDPVLMESKSSHQSADSVHLWSAYHYNTLKNAVCQEVGSIGLTIQEDLRRSREFVATHWSVDSMENSQSMYEVCCKLQALHEIECFTQTRQTYCKSRDVLDLQSLLSSWSTNVAPPYSSFRLFEDVLSQRCVMLENMMSQTSDAELVAPAVDLLLQYADLATSEGCPQLGIRWIGIARRIVDTLSVSSRTLSGLVTLAEGDAAWRTGHHLVAQHLMKTYINNKENQTDKQLYSSALRLYGSWMVESRSENALDILEKYLIKSLQELSTSGDPKERIKTYIIIAKFSDGEYKQVNSYMKSTAFLNKIKCMEQCKEKASSLRENHSNKIELTKDERKALFINDGQSKIDQIEITNTRTERNYFLQLAIKYYLTTLLEGDSNDLCIFRVISLWLDNPTLELATKRDSSNSKSISDLLKSIPSRKLLPVVSQLAPRLNSVDPQPHHKIIFDLIERCLLDHPHHVLPVLLALKNSYKDTEYSKDSASQSQTLTVRDAYVVTAKRMLDGVVKKGSPKMVSIVKETELLSLALISLANFKVRNSKSMEQLIPKSEPLVKIKNLRNALIPTVTLPVRADCNYEDIPSVVFFSDKFFLVGGINVPKKMACTGSDGIQRPMLLKGEDDIRQDAVMQQVFVIVNQLLSRHQHRDTKKLTIRTYKVVALSRRSGIIEWCDGTEPLGRLLVGANSVSGLHAAVRPGDMSSREARKLMDEKRTSTNEEKCKVFKKILSKLRPVFHHFFFQNFLIPAIWYERKLAYTQSVATSSMIGYILGLGDRHVQNILVDKCTAEVIHIDLGVAFEQGRVQPTPETVPFRLTQDMVAGLGATGVEGVFTRCCERTMDVLRSNKDTLLTILEVLLCDPLYMWTISPRQAYSKQDLPPPTASTLTESSGGSGSEAERALLRVDNKLVGTEFGSTLTTAGQVARLIQQATDVSNLSRLFPGWQPYL